jgi:formiminotetrahydrofolate cyclodeaminase
MVSGLTLGKEAYKDSWQVMEKVKLKATELSHHFLQLTQEDADAYQGVLAAYRLAKETEEQETLRRAAIQKATKKAALIPLETLRSVEKLSEIAKAAVEQGNPNMLTDAAAAVEVARSAAKVASYNVLVNLPGIKDDSFVAETRKEVEVILGQVEVRFNEVEKTVKARLS